MARTIEQIVQDQVGSLFMQHAAALAEIEALRERLKALESALASRDGG